MNRVIITVVGKDTVGIIAAVCSYMAEKNINILDISQTIVQEYFNMMMEEFENIGVNPVVLDKKSGVSTLPSLYTFL